ncbi:MAG: DUF1599 domain-containing protein, partial [Bacteroidota bacterium]|nr:DUF1599 domain-containing protein [Bacteroidota bacterium]
MSGQTALQYHAQLSQCREVFINKTRDYGTSWRVMRVSSLIDQIFIKAQRIRSIEEKGRQRVADSVAGEYGAIVNYCIIALIQLELGESLSDNIADTKLFALYDEKALEAQKLMEAKNHDYGEAWREMLMTSLTDMILAKLMRIRQIMSNEG